MSRMTATRLTGYRLCADWRDAVSEKGTQGEVKWLILDNWASVDVSKHVEKKNGLNYLSWCWAWSEIVRRYPDARYEIQMFDGKPYLEDPDLGYMVMTKMVVDGVELTMWLPVMDGANKAMKSERYTYQVKRVQEWKLDRRIH